MITTKSISLSGFLVILGTIPAFQVNALDNGLAKTPPMGWNSWNIFQGDINETKIKQIADVMVTSGMKDAGYVYLNLDDNWMATSRDANGNLRGDPTRFPNGMKALGEYIHSKGLKFGIYGDHGSKTCMNVSESGSYGKEAKDAATFASWGVDYLKYDNCNIVSGSNQQTDYQTMQKALANCGRPIVFSICMWKYQSWMPAIGNLWRIADDITDTWDNGTGYFHGIINCIDLNRDYASNASPGAWNDIRTMSQTTKDILLNGEVIAVNQDSAGIQGTRIKANNGREVWCKPLGSANGTTKAVALLNRNAAAADITVNFADIGLSGTVKVRDLWAKADKGEGTGSYTMPVPSHGTGMLKISTSPVTRSARAQRESGNFSTYTPRLSNGNSVVSSAGKVRQFKVSVYMPDGRLVACKSSSAGAVVLDGKRIPAGVYVARIAIDDQERGYEKIVIGK